MRNVSAAPFAAFYNGRVGKGVKSLAQNFSGPQRPAGFFVYGFGWVPPERPRTAQNGLETFFLAMAIPDDL